MNLEDLKEKAFENQKANRKMLDRIKRQKNQRKVDEQIHDLHEEVFSRTDCMDCANCCKTTGPLFTNQDIKRISGKFRMKEADFIEKYLYFDEDNFFVLKSVPCTFLDEDNSCSIYDFRPKACREFPHTDRVKQSQIFKLTLKNTEVCPAVFEIVEKLRAIQPKDGKK